MGIKFSVVIPVYNVEKYLPDCLDSIINQTYTNLEIICVDDGSTDNSKEVLKKYALKDERIKIISQPNKGVGAARNTGIELAEGEYISFIDPDDWIETKMYEDLNDYIIKNNPQVLMFAYNVFYESSGRIVKKYFVRKMKKHFGINLPLKKSLHVNDIKKEKLLKYKDNCWTKVYSKKMLDKYHFRFSSFKIGEDTLFVLEILMNSIKIDYIDNDYYYYRIRFGSATNSQGLKDTLYMFDYIKEIELLLEKSGYLSSMRKELSKYKIRQVYEGEKYCSKELLGKYRKLARKYLTNVEFVKFFVKAKVSRLLRMLF